MSFFTQIGHGLKLVGKEAAKIGEVSAPVAAAVIPVVLPGAPGLAVDKILSLVPEHSAKLISISTGGNDLNPLEAVAISIIIGSLQQVIKNPAHAALLKETLLAVANDIYATYGLTAPATQSGTPLAK